ncbi:hypothetical protein F4V43_06955 [Paenibacillus spiritus]|uniref:Uncharacterized protein n=1 Tax=Paenibacillus spiritus TaxID=2496557 RepID=A0A5J5GD90_9BACL|nr:MULTISPECIES: hypothetical protein [Paenibacillus]KAA9005920.1 hypothetical protein F4V43_06955 [Paenibacillus spiritus]
MNDRINEAELIRYIAGKTKADPKQIALVLKHEQRFLEEAKPGRKGEVDIDLDDLVDYVLSRRDVTLTEPAVEDILEREMDYLMDKGLAGYLD